MRTVVTETEVFKFSELSEAAQAKAIEGMRDLNVDHEWWDFTYEDAKRIGVAIKHFDLGRGWEIGIELLEDVGEIVRRIISEHGKPCDTYALAVQYYRQKHRGDPFTREEFSREIGGEYLKLLDAEYDYLTSDEAIRESIEANDYEFTADGDYYI